MENIRDNFQPITYLKRFYLNDTKNVYILILFKIKIKINDIVVEYFIYEHLLKVV